ncbi:MAG: hypothetical protein ACT4OX_02430 [Actinomycetota bacterium]
MPDVAQLESKVREPMPAGAAEPGDMRLAIAVTVVGLVAFIGSTWLEPPPPEHAHDSVNWLLGLAEVAFLGLAAVGGISLFNGRPRLGFAASAGAAWVFLALVISCPTSGHHAFGAWWGGQLALTLPWVALSTVAFAVNSPSRPVREPA